MLSKVNYAPENLGTFRLSPTETEIYRTGVHRIVLFWPASVAALIAIVGVPPLVGVFARGGSLGGSIILAAIASFFFITAAAAIAMAFVKRDSIETIVTNYRVILSAGIFRPQVSYTDLDQVEKVSVQQGRLGKRLGYGTVIVCQFGGRAYRIKDIPQPVQLLECIRCQLNRGTNASAISRVD